jgi:hypothetical protein
LVVHQIDAAAQAPTRLVVHLDDVGEELTPGGHQHFLRVREPRGLAWKTEHRFDKGEQVGLEPTSSTLF